MEFFGIGIHVGGVEWLTNCKVLSAHSCSPEKTGSHDPQLSSVKVSGVLQSLQGVSGVAQQSHGCGSLQNQYGSSPEQYS